MKKSCHYGRTKWTAIFDGRSYIFMTTISMGEAGCTLRPLAGFSHLSFPRRCGGSGARSEPIGAPLFSLLPFQCLDDLREGGAIVAEDVFNETAFGAVLPEGRHRDRELQRVVNLHIEERLVKRAGRIRCRF